MCGYHRSNPEHDKFPTDTSRMDGTLDGSANYNMLKEQKEEILQRQREALERPLLAEIDALRVKVEYLEKRKEYWRKAAYGLHGESCNKTSCMEELEAKQP